MGKVHFDQRGYVDFSRSIGAATAEREGKLPLTRAIAAVSVAAVCPAPVARRVLAAIGPCEWHHVSKYANVTDYYEIHRAIRIAARVTTAAERAALLRRWTRQSWQAAADARTSREIAQALAVTRNREAAEIAAGQSARDELAAAMYQAERQSHITGVTAAYKRHPTPGRAEALRSLGIDPASLLEVAHA